MSTVIVYSIDARDARRACRSIASIRKADVTEDIVVLTLGAWREPVDPYLASVCKAIVPVDGILREFGFSESGWNRQRRYSSLACMALPLVPQLESYSHALTVSPDVLALRCEFKDWLHCPMHGFEVVGAVCAGRSAKLGPEYSREMFKCFSGKAADAMRSKVWGAESPACRTYSNPGVYLWDLALLRQRRSLYRSRLRMFWSAVRGGHAVGLADTFASVFMSSAAALSTAMNVVSDDAQWVNAAVARNYECGDRGSQQYAEFAKTAAAMGLDDDIAAVVGTASAGRELAECKAGRLAVVHITDGNPDDCQRMIWSMRSVARCSRLKFDSIVLTPPGVSLPDVEAAVPELRQHGAVRHIDDVAGTLEKLSISSAGWNRSWPFVVLYRLGIPLHEVFSGYDRVLYLDTDVLVLSDRVDQFLSAGLDGYELGGVIDTVQEEHGRIRHSVDDDLRPDFSFKIAARYGDTLRLKPYINAGVLLWNMPEIRKDIPWYTERLRMFWEAECRGRFGFLDQDFVNAMMVVNTNFSMVYNWFSRSGVEPDDGECVIRHYCAHDYERMARRAEDMGLLTKEEVLKRYEKH